MKNYNILANTGVSDVDLVNTLKLDAELAGTPGINNAAYQRAFNLNVKGFMRQGLSEGQAKSKAGRLMKLAKT